MVAAQIPKNKEQPVNRCIFGDLDCREEATMSFYRDKETGTLYSGPVGEGEVPSYCFKHAEITLANERAKRGLSY
jgi:hypothetical protein